MCLHIIIGKPEETSGVGYKAFRFLPDGGIQGFCYGDDYILGKSFIAENFNNRCEGDNEDYKSGFHILSKPESVKKYLDYQYEPTTVPENIKIVKVSYSKARINGFEQTRGGFTPCIIADEITLLEIINP